MDRKNNCIICVLVIEKNTFGGQITHSPRVENYPGFTEISGSELADKLLEQIMVQGAEIELDTVTGIAPIEGGYLVKIEPCSHNVGTCYRCKTTVEPLTSDQWFVKMQPLAKPALDVVLKGDVKFEPERFTKIYKVKKYLLAIKSLGF